jgi:hypothetical protein
MPIRQAAQLYSPAEIIMVDFDESRLNVGVHGVNAELRLERLWPQNITITTRLVDTVTTPMLPEWRHRRGLMPAPEQNTMSPVP